MLYGWATPTRASEGLAVCHQLAGAAAVFRATGKRQRMSVLLSSTAAQKGERLAKQFYESIENPPQPRFYMELSKKLFTVIRERTERT